MQRADGVTGQEHATRPLPSFAMTTAELATIGSRTPRDTDPVAPARGVIDDAPSPTSETAPNNSDSDSEGDDR